MVDDNLGVIEEGDGGLNCPHIGLHPLNEFTTEKLMVMCFPKLYLNGKGDPTTKYHLHDVTLPNGAKHLMKFSEKSSLGN